MSLEPVSLTLQGREGWLRPGSYIVAVRALWGVLHELDIAISRERKGSVEWEISGLKKSGPACVVLIGHLRTPPKDCLPEIGKALLDGIRTLRETDVRPVWYSDKALEKLKVLVQQLAKLDEASICACGREERLDLCMIARIDRIIGNEYESLTSVVGRLDSITVNGNTRFRVWCETTGHPVRCHTSRDWVAGQAVENLGKRVVVCGKLTFNSQGEPVSLDASGIERFPQAEELPNISFMSGRIPKITGDMKLGEFIATLRR